MTFSRSLCLVLPYFLTYLHESSPYWLIKWTRVGENWANVNNQQDEVSRTLCSKSVQPKLTVFFDCWTLFPVQKLNLKARTLIILTQTLRLDLKVAQHALLPIEAKSHKGRPRSLNFIQKWLGSSFYTWQHYSLLLARVRSSRLFSPASVDQLVCLLV